MSDSELDINYAAATLYYSNCCSTNVIIITYMKVML